MPRHSQKRHLESEISSTIDARVIASLIELALLDDESYHHSFPDFIFPPTIRGTRLNTCTRCPLRTFDTLLEYRRAKIESFLVEVVVLGVFPALIVFATVVNAIEEWIGQRQR
jgi:hypothetical protein